MSRPTVSTQHSTLLPSDDSILPDEVALGVDQYASVLLTCLESVPASQPFCMAIFGHWGRGKTFLLERVTNGLSRQWSTIQFNAAEYPTATQTWISLYEHFADRVEALPTYLRIPTMMRFGIYRHGPWPLIATLVSLFVAVLPLWRKLSIAEWVLSLFGVLGVVYFAGVAVSVRRAGKQLLRQYLYFHRHTEKLGPQAVIGNDLRLLLRAWAPGQTHSNGYLPALLVYLLIVVLIGVALLPQSADGPTFGSLIESTMQMNWSTPALVHYTAAGAWLIVAAVLVPLWLLRTRSATQRVLLIIDDLDRCSEAHALAVVESVRMMLNHPEVHRRVRVVALAEEGVLRAATQQRHDVLLKRGADGEGMWRDTREKLFHCFLRLPPLTQEENKELFRRYVESEKRRTDSAERANLHLKLSIFPDMIEDLQNQKKIGMKKWTTREKIIKKIYVKERYNRWLPDGVGPIESEHEVETVHQRPYSEDELAGLDKSIEAGMIEWQRTQQRLQELGPEPAPPLPAASPQEITGSLYEPADIAAMNNIADEFYSVHRGNKWTCGPRTIRRYLFQFLLAKLLLRCRNQDVEPSQLATALMNPLSISEVTDENTRKLLRSVATVLT